MAARASFRIWRGVLGADCSWMVEQSLAQESSIYLKFSQQRSHQESAQNMLRFIKLCFSLRSASAIIFRSIFCRSIFCFLSQRIFRNNLVFLQLYRTLKGPSSEDLVGKGEKYLTTERDMKKRLQMCVKFIYIRLLLKIESKRRWRPLLATKDSISRKRLAFYSMYDPSLLEVFKVGAKKWNRSRKDAGIHGLECFMVCVEGQVEGSGRGQGSRSFMDVDAKY